MSIFVPSSRYSIVCIAWFVYKYVNYYHTHSPHSCPAPMISQQELCKNYTAAPFGSQWENHHTIWQLPVFLDYLSHAKVHASGYVVLPENPKNIDRHSHGKKEGRLPILLIFIIIYLLSLIPYKFQIFSVLLILLRAP